MGTCALLLGDDLRDGRAQQPPAGGGLADSSGLVAGFGEHGVPGAFQAGDAVVFLVKIAQQVHGDGAGQRTARLL